MKTCKRNHTYSEELSQCPECQKTAKKAWQEVNKERIQEKVKVTAKAWYEANKEQVKARVKAWREANPEQHKASMKTWHEANKEQVKATNKAYQQANPDKCNARNAKRRAAKLQATPPWLSPEQSTEIEEFYTLAQELYYLNQDGSCFHVDHIIPLQGDSVCGLHVPWNLQLLPADENFKKGNKI